MKAEKRFWFVARRDAIDALQASQVMDMLRYDAARVQSNAPDGFYLMSKTETGGYPPPTAARWESFGVRICVVSVSTYQPEPAECVRAYEADERLTASRKASGPFGPGF